MSKFSNIYDIDGNLIRKAEDGPFTIEETEQLVDDLTKKVQENPDNEVYKVYLNNAQKWLFKLYNEMSREDLLKRMTSIQNVVEEAKNNATNAEEEHIEELNKIIDEFKAQYDSKSENPNTTPEAGGERGNVVEEVEHPLGDADIPTPSPVVMDEYVDFEEK